MKVQPHEIFPMISWCGGGVEWSCWLPLSSYAKVPAGHSSPAPTHSSFLGHPYGLYRSRTFMYLGSWPYGVCRHHHFVMKEHMSSSVLASEAWPMCTVLLPSPTLLNTGKVWWEKGCDWMLPHLWRKESNLGSTHILKILIGWTQREGGREFALLFNQGCFVDVFSLIHDKPLMELQLSTPSCNNQNIWKTPDSEFPLQMCLL